jgi:hypothetical protein
MRGMHRVDRNRNSDVGPLFPAEGYLEDLYERYRQACLRRNHVHCPLIHQFPVEIVSYIFSVAFPPREAPPCCKSGKASPSPLILVPHMEGDRVTFTKTMA